MNPRRDRRKRIGLTQGEAAGRAGVSFATWRRWEEDPESVREGTRAKCERVLDSEARLRAELADEAKKYETAWGDCPYLTPRQASAIASVLSFWSDLYIGEWLREPSAQPLHEVSPFDGLDLRVMMLVGENRAWAASFAKRCDVVVDEIENGVLPFDRPGCFADELLIALALPDAQSRLEDMPELFDAIAARVDADDDGGWTLDDEWDAVSDAFDDQCRWDEWEVPTFNNHVLLPAVLAERHPYRWFDPEPGTGSGYLRGLAFQASGITVPDGGAKPED